MEINVVFQNENFNDMIDYNKLTRLVIQAMKAGNLASSTEMLPTNQSPMILALNNNENIQTIQTRIDTSSMVYRQFPKNINMQSLFTLWHF